MNVIWRGASVGNALVTNNDNLTEPICRKLRILKISVYLVICIVKVLSQIYQ